MVGPGIWHPMRHSTTPMPSRTYNERWLSENQNATYPNTHTRARAFVRANTYTHAHTLTHTRTRTQAHTRTHTRTHTTTQACTRKLTHAYTHGHTYALRLGQRCWYVQLHHRWCNEQGGHTLDVISVRKTTAAPTNHVMLHATQAQANRHAYTHAHRHAPASAGIDLHADKDTLPGCIFGCVLQTLSVPRSGGSTRQRIMFRFYACEPGGDVPSVFDFPKEI